MAATASQSSLAAEDRGAGKKPPAKGGQLGALRLAEPSLETNAQVVGAEGEMAGGLGRPERTATQALQTKLGAQFLDAVFDIRATVIPAPDFEGRQAGRQLGPQRLELVAGTSRSCFPPACGRSATFWGGARRARMPSCVTS